MTLQWFEEAGSRSASVKRLGTKDTSSCTVKYRCVGTMNDIDVHNQANIFFTTNRTYRINGVNYLVVSYDLTHLGGDAWEVTATYESEGSDDRDPLRRSRSFDTTGATVTIKQAYDEKRFPTTAPDMGGAVNVGEDGPQGAEIVIPQFSWQEQYDVPHRVISDGYFRMLANQTGTTNKESFRGFAQGEVLFLGASGSQGWDEEVGAGPWSLTYKFAASPTLLLDIEEIEDIRKGGHDYMWVQYEKHQDGANIISKPKYVYVNQVYRQTSFGYLGIGS